MAQYYISNAGSDAANGITEATAWETISQINNSSFTAGDRIAFRRGDTWSGTTLVPPDSGIEANPIVFTAYGVGAPPIIYGDASNDSVHVNGTKGHRFEFLDFGSGVLLEGADTDPSYITIWFCKFFPRVTFLRAQLDLQSCVGVTAYRNSIGMGSYEGIKLDASSTGCSLIANSVAFNGQANTATYAEINIAYGAADGLIMNKNNLYKESDSGLLIIYNGDSYLKSEWPDFLASFTEGA